MNTALLAQSFSSAIRWNGIAHAITQLLFFLRTAILYATLSAQDFSLWAQSMSVMFLLLLWFDCGFRKSIPQPTTVSHHTFSHNYPAGRNPILLCGTHQAD